jgi:hypothetical protein
LRFRLIGVGGDGRSSGAAARERLQKSNLRNRAAHHLVKLSRRQIRTIPEQDASDGRANGRGVSGKSADTSMNHRSNGTVPIAGDDVTNH